MRCQELRGLAMEVAETIGVLLPSGTGSNPVGDIQMPCPLGEISRARIGGARALLDCFSAP